MLVVITQKTKFISEIYYLTKTVAALEPVVDLPKVS